MFVEGIEVDFHVLGQSIVVECVRGIALAMAGVSVKR